MSLHLQVVQSLKIKMRLPGVLQMLKIEGAATKENGYAWRKYGQKKILNTKYLRSYYRCTHKDDQNCPAIKKVQRIQEDPPLYRTTYYGHHNCKSSFINPEVIKELDTSSSSSSSIFLNFNNSSLPNKEAYPFSSSLFPSTKQEPMELISDYHIG